MDNASKALAIALSLLDAATKAYNRTREVIRAARADGRDVTDAELDTLRGESQSALDAFKKQVG